MKYKLINKIRSQGRVSLGSEGQVMLHQYLSGHM